MAVTSKPAKPIPNTPSALSVLSQTAIFIFSMLIPPIPMVSCPQVPLAKVLSSYAMLNEVPLEWKLEEVDELNVPY